MHVEIKIAVLPLVKAFLAARYNIEPFDLYRSNQYGILLYNSLISLKKVNRESAVQLDGNRYSETLRIKLTEDTWRRKGSYLHPARQIDFNNTVLCSIDDLFIAWVDSCVQVRGSTMKTAFYSFREKYNLDEDVLTLKSMEKKYERHRKLITA